MWTTLKDLFKSKTIRKQVLYMLLIFVGLLTIVFTGLGIYTRHGETVTVPNLKGLKTNEAIELLESQGFRCTIDSIYNIDVPKGTVFDQEPSANSKVKENRMLYLTVVSMSAPTVKMPDLKDVSLREATAILESFGIKVGALIYKPDLAQNAVLQVLYKNVPVQKGFGISKGSTVDLVLGDGYGNMNVTLPNFIGMTLDEALFVLEGNKLNLGNYYLEKGKDSLDAKVYKQIPPFDPESQQILLQGESVDLYFK